MERRFKPGAAVLNDRVLVVGGYSYTPPADFKSSVESYDPSTDKWSLVAEMLEGRYAHTVGVLNGFVYAVGGTNPSLLDTVEWFQPGSGPLHVHRKD